MPDLTPADALARLQRVVEAASHLAKDPADKSYPIVDCYESGDEKDDAKAPMWTEAGLYGRFGKEAARTLLARHRKLADALADLDLPACVAALSAPPVEPLCETCDGRREVSFAGTFDYGDETTEPCPDCNSTEAPDA